MHLEHERFGSARGSEGCLRYLRTAVASSETPVVFLHGILSSLEDFEHFLRQGADPIPAYALEHRGHGESKRSHGLYGIADYAADASRFLSEVVRAPAILAGHSLGAVTAVRVAASGSPLVAGLLLEDPPLWRIAQPDRLADELGFAAIAQLLADHHAAQGTIDDMAHRLAAGSYFVGGRERSGRALAEFLDAEQLRLFALGMHMCDPAVLEPLRSGSMGFDADVELPRLRCPVALLHGSEDKGSALSAAEITRFQQLVPQASVKYVPQTGHNVHLLYPAPFRSALQALRRDVENGRIRG